MLKLVVLFAIATVAVARPGFLHGGLALHAPLAVAVPAAVSHSYRTDIISKPIVTYAAVPVPVVHKTVVAAPIALAAPHYVAAYSGHPW